MLFDIKCNSIFQNISVKKRDDGWYPYQEYKWYYNDLEQIKIILDNGESVPYIEQLMMVMADGKDSDTIAQNLTHWPLVNSNIFNDIAL